MIRLMALVAIIAIAVAGCQSFEDLEAGNAMATTNQTNLEKNTMRAFDNLKTVGQAYAKAAGKKWSIEDETTWSAMRKEAAIQLAINYAWLLVIKGAIEQDSLNAGLFKSVLDDLPDWINQGKAIYELVNEKTKKK